MTSRSPVQVSTQLGSKNVTLSADTPEEMAKLTDEFAKSADAIVDNLTTIDQILTAKSVMTGVVGSPAQPSGSGYQTTPPPSGVAQTGPPSCVHGAKKFGEGTSSKGPWSAYFCPAPKDDPSACKPQWIKS